MPVYNVTVDDSSPLFQYYGSWEDSAQVVANAFNGTTHSTGAANASVFIPFQGTDIYIYGSKDTRHGHFQAKMDGHITEEFDANSQGEESQALLMSWAISGASVLELVANSDAAETNQGVVFDVDYAIITAGDGDASTHSHDTVLDDSSFNITYSSNFLNCQNGLLDQYFNQTMHCIGLHSGSAIISFYGNAIAVYGATSSNHGAYLASVDNAPAQMLNGSAPTFRPQSLLFLQSGLNSGHHTLNLTNNSPLFLDLDYAVVSVWDGFNSGAYPSHHATQIAGFATSGAAMATSFPMASSAAGSSPSGTSTSPMSQSAVHTMNAGAVAGGVVGGLLVLVAFGVVLFILVRRLRSEQAAYRAERGWQRPAVWSGRNKSTPAATYHAPLPRWHRQGQMVTQ